jgi:hypothetical protein
VAHARYGLLEEGEIEERLTAADVVPGARRALDQVVEEQVELLW